MKKNKSLRLNYLLRILICLMVSSSYLGLTTQTAQAKTSSSQVKILIRTLFYGYTQAFTQSTASGASYMLKNNYPNILIKSKSLRCASGWPKSFTSSQLADLNSIMPDPNWIIPSGGPDDNPKVIGTKPKGETFIVTTTYTTKLSGKETRDIVDVHVTILNGKAYFYKNLCGN